MVLVRVVVFDDIGNVHTLLPGHKVSCEAKSWHSRSSSTIDPQMNRRHSFHPPTCIDEGQGMGKCGRTAKHTVLDVGNASFTLPYS